MISIYLASVDFHLTRLLWRKVSPYSANPLTRDKETETTSILLVKDPPEQLWVWVRVGGSQELGRLPVRTVALRAEHRAAPVGPAQLWGAGSRQPSPSPPFPNPGPRHGAWPGTESQSCCNVKQTWQQEPAAPGTSPLAIFSCFSRETRLMQPACESRGSGYCSTQHLHLLDAMVAPG